MAQDLIGFIKENLLVMFLLGLLCNFAIWYMGNNQGVYTDEELNILLDTSQNITNFSIEVEKEGYEFENLSKGADPESSVSGVSKETVSGAFDVIGQGFESIKKSYLIVGLIFGVNGYVLMSFFIGLNTFVGVLLALRHIFGKY